jgi:hypothetical protein
MEKTKPFKNPTPSKKSKPFKNPTPSKNEGLEKTRYFFFTCYYIILPLNSVFQNKHKQATMHYHPRTARRSRRRPHSAVVRRQKGSGWFKRFFRKANSFLKRHKVISRGSNLLAKVLPAKYGKAAQGIGAAAGALGYGRMRGKGVVVSGGMRHRRTYRRRTHRRRRH